MKQVKRSHTNCSPLGKGLRREVTSDALSGILQQEMQGVTSWLAKPGTIQLEDQWTLEPCSKGSPRRVQEHTHVHSRPCPYRGFVDAIEPGDALLVLALALLEDIVTESTLVVVVDPALLPIDGRFVQRD